MPPVLFIHILSACRQAVLQASFLRRLRENYDIAVVQVVFPFNCIYVDRSYIQPGSWIQESKVTCSKKQKKYSKLWKLVSNQTLVLKPFIFFHKAFKNLAAIFYLFFSTVMSDNLLHFCLRMCLKERLYPAICFSGCFWKLAVHFANIFRIGQKTILIPIPSYSVFSPSSFTLGAIPRNCLVSEKSKIIFCLK